MKKSIRFSPKIWLAVTLVLLISFISCQKQGKEAITEEEVKALLDRYLEIWNDGNLAMIDEVCDPEFVLKSPAIPEPIVGIEALKSFVKNNAIVFPDFRVTIEEMIVKGDKIVSRFTIKGTNKGPLGELPPTGKKVNISEAVAVTTVANGKIIRDETFWNVLDFYQQLGFSLVPPSTPQPSEKSNN